MIQQNPVGKARYKKREIIGEGSYGIVYRAFDSVKRDEVAIKKIHLGHMKERKDQGVSVSAIREIKILKEVKHENIIELRDVFVSSQSNLNLVYELMEIDLREYILRKDHHYSDADIKCLLFQILKGADRLHKGFVIHRDLKPDNILLARRKPLKITDFGLAKVYSNPKLHYSPQCCTLWYRAPELLYGATKYGPAADIWSIGCIFAELILRNPLFAQTVGTEIEQLSTIFSCLGTPTDETWKNSQLLDSYVPFTNSERVPFENVISAASRESIDLLTKMLLLDPNMRISAENALAHDYFKVEPKMTSVDELTLPRDNSNKEEEEDPQQINPESLYEEEEEEEENDGITKNLFF